MSEDWHLTVAVLLVLLVVSLLELRIIVPGPLR